MSIKCTFVGTLGGDVELKFTQAGLAVASFNVATSKRVKDGDGWKDGPTSWVRCTVWRQYAENVAESLVKGSRVIVTGEMAQRDWTTKEGEKRTVWECQVDEVGPVLRYATATIKRVERDKPADAWSEPATDPWATPQADEAPF
jgi:single-strand DNA-binding protein